jgi:hypothetical protein
MGKLGWVLGVWVAVLVGTFVFASGVSAEVRLDWRAAEGCPDAAAVRSTMHRSFESEGASAALADVQIDAEVERSGSGYALALELRTPSGVRRMRMAAASCDVFSQVVALQAALLITSDGAQQRQPPAAAAAFALRAQGLVVSSPLPAPAFGLGVVGAYVALPLRVELAAGYLFARERRFAEHPEVGGSLQAGSLGLRPCLAAVLGVMELLGCAGAEAGFVRGKGLGVSNARATNRTWLALVAGAGLHVPVSPMWSFWLGADLLVSLTRPVFYVAQLGPLYRSERLGVRGSLGIELRIR